MNEPEIVDPSDAEMEALLEAEGAANDTSEPDPSKPANDTDKVPANDTDKPKEPKSKPKDEPEPEADKETEEASMGHRALQLREKKFIERQQRFTQERAHFESERNRFVQEVNAYGEEKALAKRDPLAYLERVHGFTLEDLGRRILNDGRADPTEEQRRYQKTIEEKLEAMERKLREREEEVARARYEQSIAAEKARFCQMVRAQSEFPLISARYDDEELAEEAIALVKRARALHGEDAQYTNDEIAEALEERERQREARAKGGRAEESKVANQPKSVRATPGKSAEPRLKPAPTLSGKAASAMTPANDYDPLLMTEDELDQLAIRSAREAMVNGAR